MAPFDNVLKKGWKTLCKSCEREEGKKCERNSPADTKVHEEGVARGAPGAGVKIPLQSAE